MTPQETENFFHVLRRLKAEGHGIIIITHRLSEIMAISDRVTILRDGKAVKDLVTSDTTPEELSAFMIGRPLSPKTEDWKKTSKEAALSLEGVSLLKKRAGKKALDHICLTVYKGRSLELPEWKEMDKRSLLRLSQESVSIRREPSRLTGKQLTAGL